MIYDKRYDLLSYTFPSWEIENCNKMDFSVSALVCQLEMESFPRAKLFFQHENGNFRNEVQPSGGSFHLNAGKIVR